MRYYLQGLLFTLISFFTLSSCEKADSIGLDIDPADSINSDYLEQFNINTLTVKDDSIATSSLAQYPLGSMSDAAFGSTEAGIAMVLNLPSSGFSFGTSAEIDSAVLVMRYGTEFNGDSLAATTYRIDIHELSERYGSLTHYNVKEWNFGASQVGSAGGIRRFAWRDSIHINEIVKGGADTAVKVAPQLRIRLDEFARQRLLTASASNFSSNVTFQNYLKGLYVKLGRQEASQPGGVVFLNLQDDVSKLEVYYRNVKESGEKDTLKASFDIAGAASSILHDYTGTQIEEQLANPELSYSTVFTQSLAGIRAKIDFPELASLKQLGNIAINKAELVIYVDESLSTSRERAPALTLYQTDIAGQRSPVPDQKSISYGSVFDSDKKRYVFNISSYIQNVISGKSHQSSLFIAPLDPNALSQQSYNINPVATTAVSAILSGSENAGNRIKLNIYYTKPH